MDAENQKIFGKKIRMIEINHKLHLTVLLILLILANIMLILSLIYFCVCMRIWFAPVLSGVMLSFCVLKSVKTYLGSKKLDRGHKYTIYENGLSLKSIWYDQRILYSNILMVEAYETFWDRIFKTKTLVIYVKAYKKNKILLPYICEDINNLSEEILSRVIASREKHFTSSKSEVKKKKSE